ncbi:MAG: carbonic anhydrase [Pirellulaceae bacterium]|nr:carbonic anhydrase [Pirellulaceae bacterium]
MQQLVNGIHHFQRIGFREREELFGKLQHGQAPEACLITCADSRIVPNLITNSEPGQLFILRNVGNIIPCYGTSNNGTLAAIEYAVVELGIEDLIVCGHTCCGAMQALVKSADATGPSRTPLVANWLRHADATLEIVREHYQHLQGQALFNAAAEENVLVQLEHLRSLPVVASRISSGRVRLHGWMYKIDSGEVFYYESEVGQFVKFGEATADSGARLAGARSNPG